MITGACYLRTCPVQVVSCVWNVGGGGIHGLCDSILPKLEEKHAPRLTRPSAQYCVEGERRIPLTRKDGAFDPSFAGYHHNPLCSETSRNRINIPPITGILLTVDDSDAYLPYHGIRARSYVPSDIVPNLPAPLVLSPRHYCVLSSERHRVYRSANTDYTETRSLFGITPSRM